MDGVQRSGLPGECGARAPPGEPVTAGPGGLPERGEHGVLAGQFTGRGTADGAGRTECFGEPEGVVAGPVAEGYDRLAAEQFLRRVLVEPLVLLVGHHMSLCVHGRECVTPGVTPAGAAGPPLPGR